MKEVSMLTGKITENCPLCLKAGLRIKSERGQKWKEFKFCPRCGIFVIPRKREAKTGRWI
jgi:predicted RNA-binding Zn-ribbon protein involved in translation (DUF1610 family)